MTVPFESAQWSLAAAIAAASKVRKTSDRATDILNVLDFGADPSGVADSRAAIQSCLDAAFGPASSPNGNNAKANKAIYIPAGLYQLLGPLVLTSVSGGLIFGAGRQSTTLSLQSGVSTDAVMKTNGCSYTTFTGINFSVASNAAGIGFDLDITTPSNPVNIQSNTFYSCNFGAGTTCCRVNFTNEPSSQGSENWWVNCYFLGVSSLSTTGLNVLYQNALMNGIIGGNIAQCTKGIWVQGGSVPLIHGISFQNGTGTDIYITGGNPDNYSIAGCRSESTNFVFAQLSGAGGLHIAGCNQWSTGGTSVACDATVSVDNCNFGGQFYLNCALAVRNSLFQSSNPLTGPAGNFSGNLRQWDCPPPGQTAQSLFTVAELFTAQIAQCKGLRLYVSDAVAPLSQGASFNATSSSTTLTVTGTPVGVIVVGQYITSGASAGTQIVGLGTGTGGAGTYTISPGQTIGSSTPMTTGSNIGATVGSGLVIPGGGTNIIPVFCDGTNWRVG